MKLLKVDLKVKLMRTVNILRWLELQLTKIWGAFSQGDEGMARTFGGWYQYSKVQETYSSVNWQFLISLYQQELALA